MTYDLTVLVPGIRPQNWWALFKSIEASTKRTFEMIVISPYDLPKEFWNVNNVKAIKDYGSPIRCQQRGLTEAQGNWITWAADDGVFLPEMLDQAFDVIEDYKTVVMGKYTEGDHFHPLMLEKEYYRLRYHEGLAYETIPKNYYMLNVGIISKQLLLEIGGWDCQFEVCPMAYIDLAIRVQRLGIVFKHQNKIMFKCSHTPNHEGDHGPIHDAQQQHDEPLFRTMYKNPSITERKEIDINNWKKVPEIWTRRFDANNLPK